MPSLVEIINGSLLLIGANLIVDITERNGRIMNNFYPTTRDEVLASAEWNFAKARKQLSRLAAAPAFEFLYQYTLPTDPYCLRVTELYDSDSKWKIEGRNLLVDDDTVKIKYISRIEDTMQFSPMFVKALQFYLASLGAFPVMRDTVLCTKYYEMYLNTISDARTANSQEGTIDEIENDEFLTARI